MSDSPLFSEHWFRVRDLTPRLASDVEVRRHVYRQQVQYILHRKSTGAYYRLDAQSFELVGKLDGATRLDELWKVAIEVQDTKAPTQAEFIQLLAQLHEADLLMVNRKLNAEQLFNRAEQQSRTQNRQRYLNPLYMRFALFDPDELLTKITPIFQVFFNRVSFVLWVMLIFLALIGLAPHWNELQAEIAGFAYFSPRYAMLFLVVYPILKLFHELAHGVALKQMGGEVHELGIALMVLLPIPYVDASAAAALADKRQRIFVSAAGIILEIGIAAIATLVWLSSEGLVHDVALILMLVGGLSTIIFNANPLLKFDGYYILADSIEIPNLALRSKHYLKNLGCQLLLGQNASAERSLTSNERSWLISYGVLSFLYRFILMLTIAYLLSGQFFFFGTALAIWVIFTLLIKPSWQYLRFLQNETADHKPRAILISSATAAALLSVLVLVPLPQSTFAEGIIWLPEHAIVRVNSNCEVSEQYITDGHDVQVGDALFICIDTELPAQISTLRAQLRELEAERHGLLISRRAGRKLLYHKINTAKSNLTRAEARFSEQVVRAQSAGRLVIAETTKLEGRYLAQGSIAAFVVPAHARTVHVPIEQDDIDNVKGLVKEIEIQFSEQRPKRLTYHSTIIRQAPQASFEVPSPALTMAGGGNLLTDPSGNGRMVLEPIFNVELAWPENAPELQIGSRVWVKFEHSAKPIFARLFTRVQRAFMGRLQA